MNLPELRRSADRLRPVYRFYRLAWTGLDLVYPPHCGGCGRAGARWCSDCQSDARILLPPLCDHCGQSLEQPGLCPACRSNPPAFTSLRSWAIYNGALRNAIHRLKYSGDMAMGEILARPLVEMVEVLGWPIDIITPVPVGVARRLERGYNQAALLAFPVALGCGLSYQSKAISKVRETRSQVGLNGPERKINVDGAFQADQHIVQGKCVLVIDDVTTSGATMQASAIALFAAGSRQVYGLTLARAVHPQPELDVPGLGRVEA